MSAKISIDPGYWQGVGSAEWLESIYTADLGLAAKFEAFVESLEDDYDRSTWSDIDLFISSHEDHDFGPSDNTYNGDSLLIDPVVHHQFTIDGVRYGWYRIHQGGDVRNNNYSYPVFVNFDEADYSDYEGFNLYPELEAWVEEILPIVPDTIPLFEGGERVAITGSYRTPNGFYVDDVWCEDDAHADKVPENIFGVEWVLESDFEQDSGEEWVIIHGTNGVDTGETLEYVLVDLRNGRRFTVEFSISEVS